MDLLIGIVGGGIASWLITHFYYKIGARGQKKQNDELSKKLSREVKEIILSTQKDSLSVIDLNKLLEDKTIGKEGFDNDPLPFIACPKCGSTELEKYSREDYEHDEIYFMIQCKKCGWGDWTQ